jgi:hypothetical protein
MDIDFQNGLFLYVFPGTLSPNDILIRFKDSNLARTRIRQPSHIHWAADILIKKDNDSSLTNQFLNDMLQRWSDVLPLNNRQYQTIFNNLSLSRNVNFVKQFKQLDKHGFFQMDFVIHLMELLMLQEKTNNPNAYMFKNVVNAILNSKDLYAIISKANITKRRRK